MNMYIDVSIYFKIDSITEYMKNYNIVKKILFSIFRYFSVDIFYNIEINLIFIF